MKKALKKYQAAVLAGVILVTQMFSLTTTVSAETLGEMFSSQKQPIIFDYDDNADYLSVLESYRQAGYVPPDGMQRINIGLNEFIITGKSEYKNFGDLKTVLWDEDIKQIDCAVNIEKSGLYTFGFTYCADLSSGADVVRGMKVDGAYPYKECNTLVLPRRWESSHDKTVNSAGDEVAPTMTQSDAVQNAPLYDGDGKYSEPFQIYLSEGRHIFSFEHINMSVYLAGFFLDVYEAPKNYETVSASYGENPNEITEQHIEAEDAILYTNDSVLNMVCDGDPLCSPISRGKTVMNTVGGTDGQDSGSSVTYTFNVKNSGYYKIALRVLQNYRDGLPSYRMIQIDGNVPFEELKEYKFYNKDYWRTEVLSDEKGDPFLFYLTEGDHTISFRNVQGDFYRITQILNSDARKLSDLLLRIRNITGNDPDYNYDYKLDKKIPELSNIFDELKENMQLIMNMLNEMANQETAKYNELKNMMNQIVGIQKDYFKLPRKLNDLDTIVSQYSSWMLQFTASPLKLDYMELYSPEKEVKSKRSNFLQSFYSTMVNFAVSFVKDYNNISYSAQTGDAAKTIDVWISRGTDWATITKRLIDDSFTSSSGISVKLNVLTAGQLNSGSVNTLMLSIASGRAPDVCMGVSTASVGEFAMRDVLTEISNLDGYTELENSVYEELMIPHQYENKTYGFPETMNFWIMLYRKDILSDLKIALPDTWEELYRETLPILLQNNMQFYLPLSTGWELFPTLLYQRGGTLYNDDLTQCSLNTPVAFDAFDELCNMVKKYGFNTSANFFNRFRSGEMPIGVVDMTTYMQVLTAAPELSGRWDIALIPGYKKEDGNVDRTFMTAADTSIMLVKNSNNRTEEAWQFVKWWMSQDTQSTFGSLIEAKMGSAARWNSANVNAFFNMSWDKEHAGIIKQAYESIDCIPIVLGGYYTNRFINNAYNRTAISKISDAREALEEASEEINAELARKRK